MFYEHDNDMFSKLEKVREHMTEAKIPQEVRWLVEQMLILAWTEQERLRISDEVLRESVETFSSLIKGHRLIEESPDEVWVQAKNGALVVGNTVRVRADAYEQEPASAHNGRVGRIVALRYGDIHVQYEPKDGEQILSAVRHKAEALEKRIQ